LILHDSAEKTPSRALRNFLVLAWPLLRNGKKNAVIRAPDTPQLYLLPSLLSKYARSCNIQGESKPHKDRIKNSHISRAETESTNESFLYQKKRKKKNPPQPYRQAASSSRTSGGPRIET